MKKLTYLFAIALGVSTISLAQNLGINTDGSDPDTDALLHLLNTNSIALDPLIRLENQQNASVNGIELLNSGGATAAEWDLYIPSSTTDFRVSNGTTDHVTIQNDGDVGIGTASPEALLHIENPTVNNTVQDMLILETHNNINEFGSAIYFKNRWNGGDDWGMARIKAIDQDSYGGQLIFETNNGGTGADEITVEAMRIDENGRVGIGTTSLTSLLSINGTTIDADPAVHFQLSETTTFSMGIDDSDADKFKIGTSAIATNTRMTIDADGDVGIGNSSPEALLHIENPTINNTVQDMLILETHINAVSNGSAIYFKNKWNGTNDWGMARIKAIEQPGYGGQLIFETNNGNSGADETTVEAMRIDENGNLGIGTTGPGYTLDVAGDINYSGSLSNVSDKRYKKDINKIDNALGLIAQFDGYNYNFRKDEFPDLKFDTIAQIGFIAQELQKVLPQLVSQNDSGYLSVNYIKVVPILLMGMKEQQAIIEAQKKEIAIEKAENESQKAEIENLKQATSSSIQRFEAIEAKLNALLQAQTATVSAVK